MKIKIYKFFFFLIIFYLIFLGFLFNFKLANNKVVLAFTNEPKENDALRKLVYVSGGVNKPGVYEFNSDMRIVEIIDLAGGFSDNADKTFITENLNLAEKLKDEQKIFIPIKVSIDEIYTSEIDSDNSNLININTATLTELDKLPGIGPASAQKIIDNRPFSSKEDLMDVPGIGESKFGEIVDLIAI